MFKFDMYLLMARCYGDNAAPLTADPAPVTNPKKRKKKKLMQEAAQQVHIGIESGLRWPFLACRHMLAGAALQQRECQLPCTDCPMLQVPLLFWRPEDEYYHQHCTASFSFAVPTSGSRPGEEGFEPRRCVMLLTPAQISAARYSPTTDASLVCHY